MKYLFLDIDGVLNDHTYNSDAESCTLLPQCVEQMNRIIHVVPDVQVIVSSAWRYMVFGGVMTWPGFLYMLRTHGVTKKLVIMGCTKPDEEIPNRGAQISDWIASAFAEHRDITFVVLDDAPDTMCFRGVEDRLVKTQGNVGLTVVEADQVINLLLGGKR